MGIAITELTPVEQTALVTQYARALDSRSPRPILGDTVADEIVAKIDYDFQAWARARRGCCAIASRGDTTRDRRGGDDGGNADHRRKRVGRHV
jgi:O-methyltransferase involved in polyketide biosynthesis